MSKRNYIDRLNAELLDAAEKLPWPGPPRFDPSFLDQDARIGKLNDLLLRSTTCSFEPPRTGTQYGERPEYRYQSAYHRTSARGAWHTVGQPQLVTNITLPNIPGGVKFYIADGSSVSSYGPVEFKVLIFKMGIKDRDTGYEWSADLGLQNGCILPPDYTPEQLAHRAAWLLRGAMDHEWREHFLVNGRRVLDPHGKTELFL